jgi:hypothetical protein
MNDLSDEPTTGPPTNSAPGSPGAVRDGCRCSVLLNQAVGGADVEHPGFVNPLCPVHGSLGSEPGAGPDADREPESDPDLPVLS